MWSSAFAAADFVAFMWATERTANRNENKHTADLIVPLKSDVLLVDKQVGAKRKNIENSLLFLRDNFLFLFYFEIN